MNKYYIKKGTIIKYRQAVRYEDSFHKLKWKLLDCEWLKEESRFIEIRDDRKGWRHKIINILNAPEWKTSVGGITSDSLFKFETDEDALLYEEMLD